jgi:hypothetical protein
MLCALGVGAAVHLRERVREEVPEIPEGQA